MRKESHLDDIIHVLCEEGEWAIGVVGLAVALQQEAQRERAVCCGIQQPHHPRLTQGQGILVHQRHLSPTLCVHHLAEKQILKIIVHHYDLLWQQKSLTHNKMVRVGVR